MKSDTCMHRPQHALHWECHVLPTPKSSSSPPSHQGLLPGHLGRCLHRAPCQMGSLRPLPLTNRPPGWCCLSTVAVSQGGEHMAWSPPQKDSKLHQPTPHQPSKPRKGGQARGGDRARAAPRPRGAQTPSHPYLLQPPRDPREGRQMSRPGDLLLQVYGRHEHSLLSRRDQTEHRHRSRGALQRLTPTDPAHSLEWIYEEIRTKFTGYLLCGYERAFSKLESDRVRGPTARD